MSERSILDRRQLDRLRQRHRGPVLGPDDPDYDATRSIWNGMIDRHPAAIARCLGAADVTAAVRFARERDVQISVRGGGHNVSGNAVSEGGLMIDLSLMKMITVDPGTRTASAQPGLTLKEFHKET